jgi:hypothetical protein
MNFSVTFPAVADWMMNQKRQASQREAAIGLPRAWVD